MPALETAGFDPETIDVVAMSHLHFDHAGGLLRADGSQGLPAARRSSRRRAEWEIALGDNPRLVASYVQPELELVKDWGAAGLGRWRARAAARRLGDPDRRPFDRPPGDRGPRDRRRGRTLVFFGDLFMRPWAANPRWVTAFDDFPLDSVARKAELFAQAADEGWLDRRCPTSATTQSAGWSAIATASGSSRSRTAASSPSPRSASIRSAPSRPARRPGRSTTWRMTPLTSMKNCVGSAKTLYSRRTSPLPSNPIV